MPAPIKTVENFAFVTNPPPIGSSGPVSNQHVQALATGGFQIGYQQFYDGGGDNDGVIKTFKANGTTVLGQIVLQGTTIGSVDSNESQVSLATNGVMSAAAYIDTAIGSATGQVVLSLYGATSNGITLSNAIVIDNAGSGVGVPEVETLADGSFLVTWIDVTTQQVKTRIYDPTIANFRGNAAIISTGQVTHTVNGEPAARDLGVTALADGGYAIAFTDTANQTTLKVFSSSGGETGTNAFAATLAHDVVQLADGRLALFTAGGNVLGVRFTSATGASAGSLIPIAAGATAKDLSATALLDGRMMVAWSQGGDILGMILNANGGSDGGIFTIANTGADEVRPHLDTLADGRVAVSWQDSAGSAIWAAVYDPRESGVSLAGTGLADDYIGSRFNDVMVMGAGNDVGSGGNGNDTIYGGTGNDTINAMTATTRFMATSATTR